MDRIVTIKGIGTVSPPAIVLRTIQENFQETLNFAKESDSLLQNLDTTLRINANSTSSEDQPHGGM